MSRYPPGPKRPRTESKAKPAEDLGGSGAGEAASSGEEDDPADSEAEGLAPGVSAEVDDLLASFMDDASAAVLQPLVPPEEEHVEEDRPPSGRPGSSNPAPAPPPPLAAPEPRARSSASAMVALPFGKIAYYDSKKSFEAICRNPDHGKCVLTRSARGKQVAGKPSRAGRPLGFMAAWLQKAGDLGSKEEHWSHEAMHPSRAERIAARATLKQLHEGPELLSFERPKAEGERSEPED